MKASVKHGQIILVDDGGGDRALLALLDEFDGHAVHVQVRSSVCVVLEDLGQRDEACREPINISLSADRRFAPISNLFPARFSLDDEDYASVEGFWQSLKCQSPIQRREIASLAGAQAKRAVGEAKPSATFDYLGNTIQTGTYAHWELMERACAAKFAQNERARRALLATGNRPLTHNVRRDSKTIPGVIMAAIWMRIRKRTRAQLSG